MESIFVFTLVIAFLIAYFLGRKRQIGFGWSFFFCIFLSPIGGFITTMLSRKYYDDNPAPSNGKKIAGWVLIVIFSLAFLGGVFAIVSNQATDSTYNGLSLTIGFIGLGFYLVELAKGKNFNSEALLKTDD